ncbi:MAG: GNAT family N-acetyltransferase [Deltaproteobacteria bacterium]|nr:GNAT family N-acetyltransferase [Deltaproteobacteria bacterium]
MRAPGAVTLRRTPGPADWERVRELCCLTGRSGAPIERERWPFFAEQWIGPYQKLLPEWAYVAESDGAIVGYLTGCPDTRAFERQRALRFTLPLLARLVFGGVANADTRRFVKRALRLERGPEGCFERGVLRALARDYPAHLHVNLDERVRGQGVGRQLIERFAADLREQTPARGIHVFCGHGPVKFYESVGFRELAAIDYGTARVFALARPL